MKTRKKR